MPTPFAVMEQRLGAAARRVFANATAVLPSGKPVDGTLTRAPAQAMSGIGMLGRDVTFACGIAELNGEAMAVGATLTISGPNAPAQTWRIRGRLDEHETGDATLTLEEA